VRDWGDRWARGIAYIALGFALPGEHPNAWAGACFLAGLLYLVAAVAHDWRGRR